MTTPAQPADGVECEHKWRNSDRADPMLPCAWVQVCKKCGVHEDEI